MTESAGTKRTPAILPGAEGFSLPGGPVGALLVHGFTGSPQSVRELGEHLAGRGLTVVAPRLPGHGTTWQDLNSKRLADWRECVRAAADDLRSNGREVFAVGQSFGATLCLDLAERQPAAVAGLVSISGFVHTKDRRRFLAPLLPHLVKSLPGVANDIAEPGQRELAYDRLPAAAARDMLRLVTSTRAGLAAVTCPLLVMHSRSDHIVHPGNALLIHERTSSTRKRIDWFDRSYHVLTLDYDRRTVFAKTFEFIKESSRHAL
ncbi:alpha/beta fold hydrolase [soil metagenome]